MLSNIQGLRALAALFVVFVHLEQTLAPLGFPERLRDAFSTGVDLFFVISGFIMVFTTTNEPPAPLVFMTRRVARIAPLYWIMTIGIFAIATYAPALLGTTKASQEALFKSIAFIPYARDTQDIRPLLFLGWSLNYEIFFYILFSVGLCFQGPAFRVFFVSLVIATCIGIGATAHPLPVPAYFFTRPIMIEFVLGMILGLSFYRLPTSAKPFVVIAIISAVGLVASGFFSTADFPIAGIPASLLVLSCLVMERGKMVLRSRAVLLVGAASYSLYLTHPFIAQAINKLAASFGLLTTATSLLWVASIYAATIVVALIVHVFIEGPMTNFALRISSQ